MRWQIVTLLASVAMVFSIPSLTFADRRVSEEALIFRRCKGGVCTVYGDNGQGSGFLVDSLGIILTNDHVVGGSSRIRVKFDDSTRVEAVFLASNDKKDVAAVRVNPAVVRGYPVLLLATPGDSMVFEGEKVIAIGSPLNQEKIMTAGIVSKIEETALITDVNINHGNSGGPLLNLNAEVVAINTFGDFTDQGGPGVSGSISITEALAVLDRARSKIDAVAVPGARRLPLASRIPFPVDSLRAVAETEKFKRGPYEVSQRVSTGKFNVVVVTPIYDAWRNWRAEVKLSKATKKREQRGGVEAATSYDPLRQMRDWMRYSGKDYAPIVTIQMSPRMGQTAGSIFGNILGATAAGLAGSSYYRGSYRYEYKADFLRAEITRDSVLIDDLNSFRTMIPTVFATAQWDGDYSMEDQARSGIVLCDPSVFAPLSTGKRDDNLETSDEGQRAHPKSPQNASDGRASSDEDGFPTIHVKVWSVERPGQPYEFDLPRATVKRVWDDFAAWRAVVAPSASAE